MAFIRIRFPNGKQEEEKDSLLKTIGEQKVEIDFLKKKYKQIYGYDPIL